MGDTLHPMQPRPQPFLTSVPLQRRLLHVGLHVALVLLEAGFVFGLTVVLIVVDVVSVEVGWKLAIGYVSWVATITTAFSLIASRFPKAPMFILGFHALAVPGSVLMFLVLNLKLVLRLLGLT